MSSGNNIATREIGEVVHTLQVTPTAIKQLVRGCSDQQLHRAPVKDAWSAHEIVAHLRACAEVWGRSIKRMLADDDPTIRYVSPRGWIKKTDFLEQSFSNSLQSFSSERAALLDVLKPLDARDWLRSATFTGTTLGRHMTVLQYAKRIADHEVGHLEQIQRTIAAVK